MFIKVISYDYYYVKQLLDDIILSHNIIDRLEIIEPPAIYFELFKGGINNIVPNNCTIILSIEMPPKNSAILYLLSEVFAAIFFIRIEMTFYH